MQARRFRRLARVVVLGREVVVARGVRARLLGLALLPRSRAGPGLLIPGCRSVHTFGMRFALDVYFLDRHRRVMRRQPAVPGCRILACAGASAVLELPATTCTRLAPRVPSSRPQKEEESDMSIFDKLTGRAKKAAGDITGDGSLRREGHKEEKKGEAKEDLNRAQDNVEEKADEVSDLERRT
jgi:uncharacterized protein